LKLEIQINQIIEKTDLLINFYSRKWLFAVVSAQKTISKVLLKGEFFTGSTIVDIQNITPNNLFLDKIDKT